MATNNLYMLNPLYVMNVFVMKEVIFWYENRNNRQTMVNRLCNVKDAYIKQLRLYSKREK
jgi:hypothetical protein